MTMKSLIELLSRSPLWAVDPHGLSLHLTAVKWSAEAGPERWQAALPSTMGKGQNKTAVIPIQGVLTKDGPRYYGTNYDTISSAAESAMNDTNVKRVILSVDSPGGEVTGLPETASLLSQLARVKPVSAMVEGTSASAAYYLTSQANDITVTPSGEVGSVGVRMMHVDISKMLEDAGYKITELHSGEFKTEWSPFQPLSEGAKADRQARLDEMYTGFLAAVTSGRGVRATDEIKAARFGEGRMFSADAAKNHGMVDRIQATRDFYRAAMPVEEDPTPMGLPRRARLDVERARAKF
jgi:capsid assembly protease